MLPALVPPPPAHRFEMAPTAKRAKKSIAGFDSVGRILDQLLLDQLIQKPTKTAKGITNSAYKQLKTSFTESLKGVANAAASFIRQTTAVTPIAINRPRRSATNRIRADLSPIPYNNDTPINTASRLDERLVPISSAHRGMKRLKSAAILRLRVGDDFTLVVPQFDNKKNDIPNCQRSDIMEILKGILMQGITSSNAIERDQQYSDLLKHRIIRREGRSYYEFNLTIVSYPERNKLETAGLPKAQIDSLLDARTGVGIYANLIGYGSRNTIHLKLLSIPYIEVFVQRDSEGPFLDPDIKFDKRMNEERMMNHMTEEFYQSMGDAAAYVEILMKYYRNSMPKKQSILAGSVK